MATTTANELKRIQREYTNQLANHWPMGCKLEGFKATQEA
jgi:hypothetical protein